MFLKKLFRLIERHRVGLIVKIGFRVSPRRIPETIRTFASTEADTAWQLIHAAGRFNSPAMRARLFPQILEEMGHAEIFGEMYGDLTGRRMAPLVVERRPLYEKDEDLWKLLVYCRIGEAEAVERLSNIARALPGGAMRTALDHILEEEAGHVELADKLMHIEGIAPQAVMAESRRIRIARRWESWLRSGRQITGLICSLLLQITYYVAGALFSHWARQALRKNSIPVRSIPGFEREQLALATRPELFKGVV